MAFNHYHTLKRLVHSNESQDVPSFSTRFSMLHDTILSLLTTGTSSSGTLLAQTTDIVLH